jgi:hypothetical protein
MLIIDRFENGFAVVEDGESGEIFDIPVSNLPAGAREGSVLKRTESGYILGEKDKKRSDEIKSLFERLKKRK